MAITVEDIEKKEFSFVNNGYNPEEVNQFLDDICDEMIAVEDRMIALQQELNRLREQQAAAGAVVKPIPQEVVKEETGTPPITTNETLQNILISAQRVSDETIAKAKERAEELVDEAQTKANELLGDMEQKRDALEQKVEAMRASAAEYRERFLGLLGEQKALLEADPELFQQ